MENAEIEVMTRKELKEIIESSRASALEEEVKRLDKLANDLYQLIDKGVKKITIPLGEEELVVEITD